MFSSDSASVSELLRDLVAAELTRQLPALFEQLLSRESARIGEIAAKAINEKRRAQNKPDLDL